jgi:hypothetical protein
MVRDDGHGAHLCGAVRIEGGAVPSCRSDPIGSQRSSRTGRSGPHCAVRCRRGASAGWVRRHARRRSPATTRPVSLTGGPRRGPGAATAPASRPSVSRRARQRIPPAYPRRGRHRRRCRRCGRAQHRPAQDQPLGRHVGTGTGARDKDHRLVRRRLHHTRGDHEPHLRRQRDGGGIEAAGFDPRHARTLQNQRRLRGGALQEMTPFDAQG